jgi:hypothetical protein
MERKALDGGTLVYESLDREAAGWTGSAAEEALRLARERWGLAPPGELQVHVLTSWPGFLFRAAPCSWRPWLLLSFPLWAARVARLWRIAGGWTQRFGSRTAVGVKPPRLLRLADRTLGERVFLAEPDLEAKVRQIAVHETVHACSLHLRLPAWLNEGLAMAAVDLVAGKATVRRDTLSLLAAGGSAGENGRRYPSCAGRGAEAFLRVYAQGYWRVRFLEEAKPGLLKGLLKGRRRCGEWLPAIARALGIVDSGGSELDPLVVEHFKGLAEQTTNRDA